MSKYLNENPSKLNENNQVLRLFINILENKLTSSLTLNFLEPLLIKCQYESMCELNTNIIANSQLLLDTTELGLILIDVNNNTKLDHEIKVRDVADLIDKDEIESS